MADLTAYSLPANLRADYDTLVGKVPPYQMFGAVMKTYFCIIHNVWRLFGAKADARIDEAGENCLAEYNTLVTASTNWTTFQTNLTNWWNGWNGAYWTDIVAGLNEKGPDALRWFIDQINDGFPNSPTPAWLVDVRNRVGDLETANGKLPVWILNPALTETNVWNAGVPVEASRAIAAVKTSIGPDLTLDPWWERVWQLKLNTISVAERERLLGGSTQLSADQTAVLRGIANHVLGLTGGTPSPELAGVGVANTWTAQASAIMHHMEYLFSDLDHGAATAIAAGVGAEFIAWMSLVAKIGGVLAPPPLPSGLEPLPET